MGRFGDRFAGYGGGGLCDKPRIYLQRLAIETARAAREVKKDAMIASVSDIMDELLGIQVEL